MTKAQLNQFIEVQGKLIASQKAELENLRRFNGLLYQENSEMREFIEENHVPGDTAAVSSSLTFP